MTTERKTTHNSTYKKLAAQWLNEVLCSVSSFVVADSFVLRNRQLLVAAKRYMQAYLKLPQKPVNKIFMKKQLEELYVKQLDKIDSHLKNHNSKCHRYNRATNPFLISVPENYTDYKNSIMIFGQETNSWCNECGKQSEYSNSLKKSLEIYQSFYIEGGIKKYRGPFWNEFKRIRKEINKSYSSYFIWNNVNKIGRMGKGNVAEINSLQFEHFDVIKNEIRILNPKVFIFFTGNDYDHFIKKNIGEFEQKQISDSLYQINFLGEFSHIQAYKTFHPNALYMKGKNRIVIPNLIEEIKKACI